MLVICPISSVGAEKSPVGILHLLKCLFFLESLVAFLSWYEDSSLLDHLDLGEILTINQMTWDILDY